MTAQQEIDLPPEIAKYGRPQRIHRGSTLSTALWLLFAGVFFLVAAGLCVFIYLKVPMKKNDVVPPVTMLYIAGGIAALGVITCLAAWWKGDWPANGKITEAYLIYPHALVLFEKDAFNIIRWDEITALVSPKGWGDYEITTRDGRSFPIKHAVKDYSNLIAVVASRVTEHVIGPLRNAIAAGETVGFGPFAVSRQNLGYKGKVLPWNRVAALEVQIGQAGRRLRIRAAGSFLPWCYANLESFPNGVLFPDLLRYVCPQQFLH